MARYLEILAVQSPSPFAVDENDRSMFTANFDIKAAAPVDQLEEELTRSLSDAGLATLNIDTFIGPAAVIPSGDGPFTSILSTGGSSPDETHNGDLYENHSVQIVTRALDFKVARTRVLAIWRNLDGIRNTTLTA